MKPNKIHKNKVILFILALFLVPSSLFALDFRARVFDPATKKALPDVQVIILETRQKYYTNNKGEIEASVPQPGFYTFRAIVPGGNLVQPRIQVSAPGQLVTIYTGKPGEDGGGSQEQTQVVGSEGIQVQGNRSKTKLSRYQVTLDEVKRIPGQFGDAMKGIQTLPGVNTPPFGQGVIYVRGAGAEDNTYLVDNLPIGYAFHLIGLNQVLHNDLISTIDIYTGAYPAEYGDAIGGIVYITTKDNIENFGGNITFSLWSMSALFHDVIGEDEEGNHDGYWIGAGRYSYMHQTLKPYIPDGIRPPIYWDGQFKIKYQFNPRSSLYFYSMFAKDTFGAAVEDRPTWDPTTEPDPTFVGAAIDIDYAYHTEALRWVWTPTADFNNQMSLIWHDLLLNIDGSIGVIDARQKAHNGYVSLKDDFDYGIYKDNIILSGGFEFRNIQAKVTGDQIRQVDPGDQNPDFYDEDDPDFETVTISDSHNSLYSSGYLMMTFQSHGLEFKPGFRADYLKPLGHYVVDPRGTISYELPTKTTFIGGGGTYHQVPDPRSWSPTAGNPNLKMEKANHYALGVQQEWGRWLFKVEGYRYYFMDLVVTDIYEITGARYKQTQSVDSLEDEDDVDYLVEDLKDPIEYNSRLGYSNDGTGYSEGYEVYIKYQLPEGKNGIYGWFSYYWSRTFRNDHQHIITDYEKETLMSADERRIYSYWDNTTDHYADFDRTVIVNLIVGWKLNREWQFGARWNYQSGLPYTPLVDDDNGRIVNEDRVIFDPVYSTQINSRRMQPYHRLDIRIDRFFHYEWGYANTFVEVLNVYLRDNEQAVAWSSARPYSRTNPYPIYDFGSLEQRVDSNHVMKFPLVNFGIEVKF